MNPTPHEGTKQIIDPSQGSAASLDSASSTKVQLPADLSFNSVMKNELVISAETSRWFDMIRNGDKAAATEYLLDLCKLAPQPVIMRWAGGCKGFSPADVEKLFEFVAKGSISEDGSRCFKGAVGSGGTMDFNKEGQESVMICQVPYYMARLFPCVAWGSTPQTSRARFDDNGQVIISKYGAHLDHRGHMNILTQDDATHFQGWNGDVRWYIESLASFAKRDYKVAVGVVNGGDVTMDEALLALAKGIPVVVVDGTDRVAKVIADAFRAGTIADLYEEAFTKRNTLKEDLDEVPDNETIARLLHVVDINDPTSLSRTLDNLGLLSA